MITLKRIRSISSRFIKKTRSKLIYLGQALLGLVILVGLFGISEYLLVLHNIAVPPAILGIAVLLIGLIALQCMPPSIQYASKPLLMHMSLFFIPAIVAIVNYIDIIVTFPVALFLAIVLSTLISLAITAFIAQKLIWALNPKQASSAENDKDLNR